MTKLKLSELESARSKMTIGPWTPGAHDRDISGDSYHPHGPVHLASLDGECMNGDRDGIIATHNAADALIRIAKAALALQNYRDKHPADPMPKRMHEEHRLCFALNEALEGVEL